MPSPTTRGSESTWAHSPFRCPTTTATRMQAPTTGELSDRLIRAGPRSRGRLDTRPGRPSLDALDDLRPRLLREPRVLPLPARVPGGQDLHRLGPGHDGQLGRRRVRRYPSRRGRDRARISATATDPAGKTSEFSQRMPFSTVPASGPPAGGTVLTLAGTDFMAGATVTVGGVRRPTSASCPSLS